MGIYDTAAPFDNFLFERRINPEFLLQMEYPMRFISMILLACFTFALPAFAADEHQPDEIAKEIEGVYASYLSAGRSDVMLHLTPAGKWPMANSTMQPDGSILCRISGLEHPSPTDMAAKVFFAGVLIHEVTHCRTSPYVTVPDGDDERSVQLRGVITLNLESIADAHALIRLSQKRNFELIEKYIARIHYLRLRPQRPDHATSKALRAAFSLIAYSETKPKDEHAAFRAAIEIGRKAAMEQAHMQYPASALEDFASIETAFDEGLQRALLAFAHGRFDNRMATLHFADAPFTPGDQHFYIGNDEQISHIPAHGTESAQEAALRAQE